MKKGTNLLKLLALILALIMAVAMFAACDEGETMVFYNDDGTIDREEYYENSILRKVRVHNHDFYNIVDYQEIYYSQNGEMVSEIDYTGIGDYNEEKESMNYICYFKKDYDENGNIVKSTTYMDTDMSFSLDDSDSIYSYTDFKYNSNNKMIKAILYDENEVMVKYSDFEYDTDNMLVKETVYNNDNSFDCVIEYDSDKMSDICVGVSIYSSHDLYGEFSSQDLQLSYTDIVYEYINEEGRGEIKYEIILKRDMYSNGMLVEHLERVEDNKIIIIKYNDDGTTAFETTIDYKGNKIE